jgi:hypothetical protein
MSITNVNELPFTTEQLTYFEEEMKKYKVPFLYKIVFGSLYKAGVVFMPVLILTILVLGLIYNSSNFNLWGIIKGLTFGVIFGIGGLVLISWILQRIKVKKECKRLGLTLYQWNLLAIAFQIKYI